MSIHSDESSVPGSDRASIDSTIEARAKDIGNKAANLEKLIKLKEKLSIPGVKIKVPEISPLTHEKVIAHLNKYAESWKTLWESFKTHQGDEEEGLTAEALKDLEALRELILETFKIHPLSDETLELFL